MGKENKLPALPQDIEENILSRVPVKTILRFRSVNKSWYSLFLEPRFITMHQKNSTKNSNNLFLMRLYMRLDNKKMGLVVMDSCSSVVHSRLIFDPQWLLSDDQQCERVLSCNGIVCINGIRLCCSDEIIRDYIYLWNPALRIIKYIKTYECDRVPERPFIGFGFHSHSNDYKVLRFIYDYKQVEIYSLSSDSWRTVIASAPPNIDHFYMGSRKLGVYVNQTHHWTVHRYKGEPKCVHSVIGFDMEEEVFKETIVPTECQNMEMILFNYNESLAMLTYGNDFHFHDVWVMKDYGLPESWIKICKIDIPRQLGTIYFRGFIQTKNELIFSTDVRYHAKKRLIVFDIDTSKVNEASSTANIGVLKDAIEVMTFRESLGLLDSKNLVHY